MTEKVLETPLSDEERLELIDEIEQQRGDCTDAFDKVVDFLNLFEDAETLAQDVKKLEMDQEADF